MVLTDSDSGTKVENRAASLQADFNDTPHIKIQVTTESTFEKELVSSNKVGDGKELLFLALTMTKPSNGPKLRAETGTNDINVDAFFAEIESHKAEFAFNLISVLAEDEKVAERKSPTRRN